MANDGGLRLICCDGISMMRGFVIKFHFLKVFGGLLTDLVWRSDVMDYFQGGPDLVLRNSKVGLLELNWVAAHRIQMDISEKTGRQRKKKSYKE